MPGLPYFTFLALVQAALASALFWSVFEQAGSTLNLFADRSTNNAVFGVDFPSSWFQSVNSVAIIVLAPVIATVIAGFATLIIAGAPPAAAIALPLVPRPNPFHLAVAQPQEFRRLGQGRQPIVLFARQRRVAGMRAFSRAHATSSAR
mgnify:CR=1 FL=1